MYKVIPSFVQGFARSAGEAKYPHLWKGLVGLWTPYLGAQGSKLYDWSGNKNDGDLTNMTNDDWIPSPYGGALNFNGADGYVNVPPVDVGTVHTVSAWAKLDTIATEFYTAIGSTASEPYFLILNPGDDRLLYRDGSSTVLVVKTFDIDFHHYVVIRNGVSVSFYVDAQQVGTTQTLGTNLAVSVGTIGRRSTNVSNHYFNGLIGEVVIYKRSLSAQEIKQLYVNPWALHELTEEVYGFSPIKIPIFMNQYRRRRI